MARSRFSLLRWGWRLFLLAIFGAGWALAAAALHVVVVPEESESADGRQWRVLLLPKDRLGFRDTYADTRQWTAEDIEAHQALIGRVIEAGKAQNIAHVLAPEQLRRLEGLLESRRSAMRDSE